MTKITLILPIFFLFLSACEKKADPNAYKQDLILADLNSKTESASKALEAAIKELEGFKKELEEVKPQTGQIKYATKRIYETEAKITRLQQEKRYYEIAARSREKEAKKLYKVAFKEGKPWPNTEEFAEYQTEERLRTAKRSWDVKQRIKEAGISIPGEEGAKKPAEGAPAGGH